MLKQTSTAPNHDRRDNDGRAHSGQLLAVGTSGRFSWMHPPALECVTLITSHPHDRRYRGTGRSVFVGDSDSATCYIRTTRLSRLVQNIESFEREL